MEQNWLFLLLKVYLEKGKRENCLFRADVLLRSLWTFLSPMLWAEGLKGELCNDLPDGPRLQVRYNSGAASETSSWCLIGLSPCQMEALRGCPLRGWAGPEEAASHLHPPAPPERTPRISSGACSHDILWWPVPRLISNRWTLTRLDKGMRKEKVTSDKKLGEFGSFPLISELLRGRRQWDLLGKGARSGVRPLRFEFCLCHLLASASLGKLVKPHLP